MPRGFGTEEEPTHDQSATPAGFPSQEFGKSVQENYLKVESSISPNWSNSSPRSHWGQGHLETGDYMLGTFRAHVHLSHNVTGG